MNNLMQRLMVGCSATAMFSLLIPSAQAHSKQPTDVESVVVSGSRISIGGFEAPTPVTVVDTEKLESNAYGNIADSVRQLPQLNSPPASFGVSQGAAAPGTAGANLLNLRNLGVNRTLVLFDGQRIVNSNLTGGVDITTLPSAIISARRCGHRRRFGRLGLRRGGRRGQFRDRQEFCRLQGIGAGRRDHQRPGALAFRPGGVGPEFLRRPRPSRGGGQLQQAARHRPADRAEMVSRHLSGLEPGLHRCHRKQHQSPICPCRPCRPGEFDPGRPDVIQPRRHRARSASMASPRLRRPMPCAASALSAAGRCSR